MFDLISCSVFFLSPNICTTKLEAHLVIPGIVFMVAIGDSFPHWGGMKVTTFKFVSLVVSYCTHPMFTMSDSHDPLYIGVLICSTCK